MLLSPAVSAVALAQASSPAGAALAGALTGGGLIVAIGAQNAFVLRQGLTRRHVLPVVAVCSLADLVLMFAGVAGLGALVTSHPLLLTLARWVGAAFLLTYGVRSALAARHPQGLDAAERTAGSARSAVATAAGFTFLNPHVYLDTVVLMGSIGSTHGADGRWWFAAGGALSSLIWFTTLGYGAGRLQRFFARPRSWQVLDAAIAVIMISLAISLVVTG